MKILHFADIHARDKDIDEVSKCLGFIVEKAQEEKPDLIVFAGDFFHSRDVKLDSEVARLVIRSFSQLADIAPVAAVLGTPLHDGKAPEIMNMVQGKYHIHVSTVPEQFYLMDGFSLGRGTFVREVPKGTWQPKAILSMLPQPTKEYFEYFSRVALSITEADQEVGDLLRGIFLGFGATASDFQAPHILVGHCTVKGAATSTGQQMIGREIEVSRESLALARAELVCLGHIHKSQRIEPNIYFAGSIYRENFGEQEAKGFLIHDLCEEGQESHFVETPTKKLLQAEVDCTEDEYVIGDLDWDLQQFSMEEMENASIRVELKIWQDQASEFDKDKIREFYLSGGAESVDIRIIRVPRETVRSTEIMKLSTLPDKVKELARIRGEEVPTSILEKADLVERLPEEEILERVQGLSA